MESEQDKTMEALQIAIQMEIDGQAYYQKLSKSSDSQAGRDLFKSLAAEEDGHRQKFEEIYDAIGSRKAWPKISFEPGRGQKIRTLFIGAMERLGREVTAPATELDSINTAMEMENRSYSLYESRALVAAHDAEREFYQALAGEERGHYLTLLDYYEYLKDPAGWFVAKEHPSLDGG